MDLRLQGRDLFSRQGFHILDAVGLRQPPLLLKRVGLAGICCHDELSDPPVGDVPLPAEVVQPAVPLHAELRLQRAGRVINSRMNDFAVAAARLLTVTFILLEQKDIFVPGRQGLRDGQPHDPGADDRDVESIHVISVHSCQQTALSFSCHETGGFVKVFKTPLFVKHKKTGNTDSALHPAKIG